MKINCTDCQDCRYYDKRSGLCGFCMKKILEEVKENLEKGGDNSVDKEDEIEGHY